MTGRVTTLILGGGQGKRLFPLTSYRSKPAVPIGGKYRLVDIPISNAINSGLHRIYVLTQFNSASLHRHIHRTYPYEVFHKTSVELLAAEQTTDNTDWFQGTADAVRKCLPHYRSEATDTFLILSGDHLYRMDYREILGFHHMQKADVTVATLPVPERIIKGFGIMKLKKDGQITEFLEKPSKNDSVESFVMPKSLCDFYQVKSKNPMYLASMGIYVFKRDVLMDMLQGNEKDFGREIIPKAIENHNVFGHVFTGYWRDIGTIGSFFEASLELTNPNPPFSFLSPQGRIFTRPRFLPPSKIQGTTLDHVLMSEGCILNGVKIERSVIGLRSMAGSGTVIRDSILMGNDFYEWPEPGKDRKIGIGKNCVIENCILDKNVGLGDNVSITNPNKIDEKDGENYYIRDGIVIIPKGTHIPSGTKI
ncbi:MAG TPA: glucose-1-phosphate adenylyltransferase [Candidatus Omnitrophota bacterium]|nr:glucose-1-phosphate adenylyltransferase [Candidatus Omnitrophota bacterium]HPS37388.1 glucose-1-phosphate adenylyltransferase [Candidatus Omnitrophota bacterium]